MWIMAPQPLDVRGVRGGNDRLRYVGSGDVEWGAVEDGG